jgi:hypothetical protein
MSREDYLPWWFAMVLRDVGLSVAVFTMITAGVQAIRFRGFHRRGVLLSCAGIGLSIVLLLTAIVGYHKASKLYSGIFAEEEEARELVARWQGAGKLDEKQLQEWNETFDSYDRMRPVARWSLAGLKRSAILWSALLVGGLFVGLILPIRDSERRPNSGAQPEK